jgi:hypothetical protein
MRMRRGATIAEAVMARQRSSQLKWHRNFAEGLLYNDQALALYDPVEDRPLATRFLQDPRVLNLMSRSGALWELGYPEAALADAEQALSEAREIGHAGALMHAITNICLIQVISGNYATAQAQSDELIALAEEKGSAYWKTSGMLRRAGVLALTGKASNAVGIFSAIRAQRSTATTIFLPVYLSILARALWGAWPVRSGLELHWRSNRGGRDNKGNMVRGRGSSHRRRNRPDVARARCSKGRSLFRSGARGRTCAAGKILGSCARL